MLRATGTRVETLWNLPQRILVDGQDLPALPASARQRSRHLTHAVQSLCVKRSFAAILNSYSFVQKLWRMGITCGKHRKRVEKFVGRFRNCHPE
jgi:hypothetical protein